MLAPSAVASATFSLRASAHPAGGFLSYRKAISYTAKKATGITGGLLIIYYISKLTPVCSAFSS